MTLSNPALVCRRNSQHGGSLHVGLRRENTRAPKDTAGAWKVSKNGVSPPVRTPTRAGGRFVAELKLAKLTPEFLSADPRVQVLLDQADVPCRPFYQG